MSSPRRRFPHKYSPFILFILLVAAVCSKALKFPESAPSTAIYHNAKYEEAVVKRVVDGDTLLLEDRRRVRLIGIDTPESSANQKAMRDSERSGTDVKKIAAMGQQAKVFTKELVSGKNIQLEFDATPQDKYGRLLAYVYSQVCSGVCKYEAIDGQEYVKRDDGIYIFVNATIIKSGYASVMTIPPNVKYASIFKNLYQDARDHKRGLWAGAQASEMAKAARN